MRKIQPENLKIMISNLTEAAGDLCELEARLDYAVNERMPKGWEGFDRIWNRHPLLTSTLYVIFEHVYHHINFAWNSRFVSASRVIACARRDYERWEKFPDDFTPLKALRKTKHARPVFDGDLNLFNLRMNVRESMIFLDGVIKEIEKAISGNSEIGDTELAWGMQRTLAHLNEAWHCRRYDITRSTDLGCKMSNLKRWQKYPREFTRLMKGAK